MPAAETESAQAPQKGVINISRCRICSRDLRSPARRDPSATWHGCPAHGDGCHISQEETEQCGGWGHPRVCGSAARGRAPAAWGRDTATPWLRSSVSRMAAPGAPADLSRAVGSSVPVLERFSPPSTQQPWAGPIRAPHSAPQHGSHCEPPAQVHRQGGAGGDQAVAPCAHWVLPMEAPGQVKPCQVSGPVRRGSSDGAACPTSTQPSRSKKLLSRAGLPPVGWRRWW